MSSEKQRTYFMRHFIREMKNSKRIILARLILMSGLPLCALLSLLAGRSEIETNQEPETLTFFMGITFAMAAAGILSGILAPLKSFSYLHKKTKTDMMLSLPANRSQMFWSGTLSGLLSYILPALPHIILTAVTAASFRDSSGMIYAVLPFEYHFSHFIMTDILLLLAGLVLFMLLIYSTVLLSSVCCGRSVLSVVSALITPAVASFAVFVLTARSLLTATGTEMVNNITTILFFCTGPVSAFIYLKSIIDASYAYYDDFDIYRETENPVQYFETWCIVSVVISVLIILVAFFLYRRRKAEDTAKPFAFSSFYYITAVLFIMSVLSAASLYNMTLIAAAVGAVSFICIDIGRRRCLKKACISAAVYALSVTVSLAFMKICDITHGFGAEYRVPSADNVISVTAKLPDPYTCSESVWYQTEKTFQSREMIEKIISIHSDITDILRKSENSLMYTNYNDYTNELTFRNSIIEKNNNIEIYNCTSNEYDDISNIAYLKTSEYNEGICANEFVTVNISYLMKSGITMNRYYSIPAGMITDLFTSYAFTDEYKSLQADVFKKRMETECYIDTPNGCTNIDIDDTSAAKISDAYRKDLENFNTADLDGAYAKIYFNEFSIMSVFENTMKAVTEFKEFKDALEEDIRIEYNNSPVFVTDTDFTPEQFHLTKSKMQCGHRFYPEQYMITDYSSDALTKLIDKAAVEYFTSEKCYVIYTEQQKYYIPVEYSSLCEDFINSGNCEELVWKKSESYEYFY